MVVAAVEVAAVVEVEPAEAEGAAEEAEEEAAGVARR